MNKKKLSPPSFEKGDTVCVIATGEIKTILVSFYYVQRHNRKPELKYKLDEPGTIWYAESELEKA